MEFLQVHGIPRRYRIGNRNSCISAEAHNESGICDKGLVCQIMDGTWLLVHGLFNCNFQFINQAQLETGQDVIGNAGGNSSVHVFRRRGTIS